MSDVRAFPVEMNRSASDVRLSRAEMKRRLKLLVLPVSNND